MARGRPTPIERAELPPRLRLMIEEAIETLIILLDEIDGDPDDEEDTPGEAEPDREAEVGW